MVAIPSCDVLNVTLFLREVNVLIPETWTFVNTPTLPVILLTPLTLLLFPFIVTEDDPIVKIPVILALPVTIKVVLPVPILTLPSVEIPLTLMFVALKWVTNPRVAFKLSTLPLTILTFCPISELAFALVIMPELIYAVLILNAVATAVVIPR